MSTQNTIRKTEAGGFKIHQPLFILLDFILILKSFVNLFLHVI
jgi:hypothetical protein